MMILCKRCGETKKASEFRTRSGKPLLPCKKCYLEYGRTHYRNNKQYYIDKARKRDDSLWHSTRQRVWKYLSEHPCIDCGNADPRVLEVDHVRGEKRHNITDLKKLRFSWAVILAKIEKCEVRCANCHRIKTYEQFSWTTYDMAS